MQKGSARHKAIRSPIEYMPVDVQPWPREGGLLVGPDNDQDDISRRDVQAYTKDKMWTASSRVVYFFCDIHADADAFFLSLLASGGVIRTGAKDEDFELTKEGRDALFIIGGDCFDKGPNNLRLLEVIHQLYLKGAALELLAGNHDIRTYLGIFFAESKDPLLDHLFVRMGKKTVPLLQEIYEKFVRGQDEAVTDNDALINQLLFPSETWYEQFPTVAQQWIKPEKLGKELRRIREKTIEFEDRANKLGMDIHAVYAAIQQFRALFFEPDGRYFWFFDKMKLAHREGSYLFVHGGIDDSLAHLLHGSDVECLNEMFRRQLAEGPFELYHGPLGNVFRTKYRSFDYDFTAAGVTSLHSSGIYAIVHGHRNILQGQRLTIRQGMLNFECDASVDCNTREVEGLFGPGGAVMRFTPDGAVQGMSTDYPYIKRFHPGCITIYNNTYKSTDKSPYNSTNDAATIVQKGEHSDGEKNEQ
ncbi:MAG: hypothetical protein NWR61_01965 [Pseudomonadales bacterium]|jgi:hypothetical protein|nr:hypothetical protein [Pseudomonadales bacterium]MDP4639786.1 hypothetical protein [Pseudomonadales bacterium]MDP4765088.1 hypothetical protein [Pseudomonadales bacterium]MDP4874860.1 hypothetical protein [Pseudomonadales bacterium]MDP5058424.1 hypothetical protein [Pseudomonadales bacterium]